MPGTGEPPRHSPSCLINCTRPQTSSARTVQERQTDVLLSLTMESQIGRANSTERHTAGNARRPLRGGACNQQHAVV